MSTSRKELTRHLPVAMRQKKKIMSIKSDHNAVCARVGNAQWMVALPAVVGARGWAVSTIYASPMVAEVEVTHVHPDGITVAIEHPGEISYFARNAKSQIYPVMDSHGICKIKQGLQESPDVVHPSAVLSYARQEAGARLG